MKKLILSLLIATSLFSCKKNINYNIENQSVIENRNQFYNDSISFDKNMNIFYKDTTRDMIYFTLNSKDAKINSVVNIQSNINNINGISINTTGQINFISNVTVIQSTFTHINFKITYLGENQFQVEEFSF